MEDIIIFIYRKRKKKRKVNNYIQLHHCDACIISFTHQLLTDSAITAVRRSAGDAIAVKPLFPSQVYTIYIGFLNKCCYIHNSKVVSKTAGLLGHSPGLLLRYV